MANILTNLLTEFRLALDVVSRELIGFTNSVTLDSGLERAGIGQTVRSFKTRPASPTTIVPAMSLPALSGATVDNVTLAITNSESEKIFWEGEEARALDSTDNPGTVRIRQDQFEQAIRALANKMEIAAWTAGHVSSSRAFGTAATTPFVADLGDAAQIRKMLDDNGAPFGARSLIINTTAGVNLRKLSQLTKVNESGSTMGLRDGELLDLFGLSVKESAAVNVVDTGTGAGYLVNNAAGLAIGTTIIAVDTGTGTIPAGSVVTFAGDANNKYVVTTALSAGSFTIGGPGLRVAIADNAAVTVLADYTANLAFSRDAIVLATRMPARPPGGDQATQTETIRDSRSGIAFEVAFYPGYHAVMFEVRAAWGAKGIKSDHTVTLLG